MRMFQTLGLLALLSGCTQFFSQRDGAEAEGRSYLRRMYPGAQQRTVSCMTYDTDNNGYVSCDAVVDGRQVPLECAASAGCLLFCNEGCKARQMVVPSGP